MNLRKLIRETLQQSVIPITDSVPAENITADYLISRIPFLKEFRLAEDRPASEDRVRLIHFDKSQYNSNITRTTPDASKQITLSHLNFISRFVYSVFERNGQVYHNFFIDNETIAVLKKDPEQDDIMNSLVSSMFNMMTKKQNDANSGSIEIKEVNGTIPAAELDRAINEINGKLFKFGEFVQKSFGLDFIKP